MSGTILHFTWVDENTPQFQYVKGGKLEHQSLAFGENFSIRLERGPECIGYVREGEWHPCPYGHSGVRKCEDCKQKEGLMIEQFCDGYNLDLFTPEDLERINIPHYLYLAIFQENVYKVGVSAVGRGLRRQIEQGSHFALILAEGMNGVLARQMETFLRRSGIPDKIPLSQKKDFMFPEFSEAQGREILETMARKYLPTLLFDHPELKKYILEPFQFKNFASFYRLEAGQNSPRPFHAVILEPGDVISGTVLSVKGPFILLETPAEKVLLNAKDLLGYAVDFAEEASGMKLQTAFQGALF